MQSVARLTTSVLSALSVVAITLGLVLVGTHALADEPIPSPDGPVRQCPNCWKCYADIVTGFPRCLQNPFNEFSPEGTCETLEDNEVDPPCPEACSCHGYWTVNGYACSCEDW